MPSEFQEIDYPLEDVRVLDLTRLLPGPLCTLYMADLGADVIKVEDPQLGDYARWIPPLAKHQSHAFLGLNRNKRSLSLDLKQKAGQDIFLQLVEKADVVIESFRPGVMDKIGLDFESLKAVNPALVYCSLTGFGQTGPYHQDPGHDINYLGYAGVLDQMGHKGENPALSNLQIADTAGGSLPALVAVVAALFKAKMKGRGRYIDSAMLDGTLSLNQVALAGLMSSPKNPPSRGEEFLSGGSPCYQVYETKDKKFMALGAMEKKFWENFCRTVKREDLISQHMLMGEKARPLYRELVSLFQSKTQNEWSEMFREVEACCTPVLTLKETLSDPHVNSREMLYEEDHPQEGRIPQWASPFKMSDFQFRLRNHAPAIGENTKEILLEEGLTEEEIQNLRSQNLI